MSKSTLGKFTLISSTLILLGLSFSGHSAVYKCQVNGKTVYQSSACFVGKQTVLHPTKHDTGLHASWFARPQMLPASPSCQTQQCQCGDQTIPLTGNRVDNLTTSLNAIITDWQRHQQAYLGYQGLSDEEKLSSSLKEQVATSACNIAMYQTLINQTYLSVLNDKPSPMLSADQQKAIFESCEAEVYEERDSEQAKAIIAECVTKTEQEALATMATQQPEQTKADIAAKFAQPVSVLKLKNPYLSE